MPFFGTASRRFVDHTYLTPGKYEVRPSKVRQEPSFRGHSTSPFWQEIPVFSSFPLHLLTETMSLGLSLDAPLPGRRMFKIVKALSLEMNIQREPH